MFATYACTSGGGDSADVVEKYLTAKVNRDADTITSLLCSAMEANLEREIHTFDTVTGVTIENMACQRDSGADTVTCQGLIVASYGTENVEFPLSKYHVVEEDGEWKWCGEAS
jgi:hypothetical protein